MGIRDITRSLAVETAGEGLPSKVVWGTCCNLGSVIESYDPGLSKKVTLLGIFGLFSTIFSTNLKVRLTKIETLSTSFQLSRIIIPAAVNANDKQVYQIHRKAIIQIFGLHFGDFQSVFLGPKLVARQHVPVKTLFPHWEKRVGTTSKACKNEGATTSLLIKF